MKEGEHRPQPEPIKKVREISENELRMMFIYATEWVDLEEQIQAIKDAGYRVEFWVDDEGGVFIKPVKKKLGFLK